MQYKKWLGKMGIFGEYEFRFVQGKQSSVLKYYNRRPWSREELYGTFSYLNLLSGKPLLVES